MAFFLEKQKTTSTPYVLVDEEKSFMRLEGCSFNENVTHFFADIKSFLKNYLATDFGTFTVECAFDYVNSTTIKLLLNMFIDMDSCVNPQKKVIVNWIADNDDDVIIECGEDFKEEMKNLEFNIIEKEIEETT